jgi:hypothetical protein
MISGTERRVCTRTRDTVKQARASAVLP